MVDENTQCVDQTGNLRYKFMAYMIPVSWYKLVPGPVRSRLDRSPWDARLTIKLCVDGLVAGDYADVY